MKSVTKTYTNSNANESVSIDSGLTNAQCACVYAITINSFTGANNQNGVNWGNANTPSSYSTPNTSGIYGNTTWVSYNKTSNKVTVYSSTTASITFYYFE